MAGRWHHTRDRHSQPLAKAPEAARRQPGAWRAPWPPRPQPKATDTEAEADDLLLRAAQAALRRGDVLP